VRGASVELGGLAGFEDQVEFAEDESESAVEDEGPVVALVGSQVGLGVVAPGRQHELVGLDAPRPPCQREDGPAVAGAHRPQVDTRIAGRRCVDELVESHAVGAGQGQQLFQRGTSEPGLKPGQRAGGDACLLGEVAQGDVATLSQPLQARSDGVEGAIQGFVHTGTLPFGNTACESAKARRPSRTRQSTGSRRSIRKRHMAEQTGARSIDGNDR